MNDIITKILDFVKGILDALSSGNASTIIDTINNFFKKQADKEG